MHLAKLGKASQDALKNGVAKGVASDPHDTTSHLFLSEFQHPWSIAIVQDQNDGSTKLHCSGSILDEKRILTAAHCFVNNDNPESVDPKNFKILAGAEEPTNQVAYPQWWSFEDM